MTRDQEIAALQATAREAREDIRAAHACYTAWRTLMEAVAPDMAALPPWSRGLLGWIAPQPVNRGASAAIRAAERRLAELGVVSPPRPRKRLGVAS